MKLSKALLDKYFRGECTAEEKELVEQWIDHGEAETSYPEEEIVEELQASVWTSLVEQHSELHSRSLTKKLWLTPLLKYAAGITLVLLSGGMFFLFGPRLFRHEFTAENVSSTSEKVIKTRKFDLLLAAQSKAHFESNCSSTGKIDFCGQLQIKPQKDMRLEFTSSCPAQTKASQQVNCLKGKSYLAFHFDFKGTEIMVVDKDRIFDLPPRLQASALKTL